MFLEDLPETIEFHIPEYDATKKQTIVLDKQQELNYDNDTILHRQLICWLAIEKYWRWVIEDQKSTDDDIADIENYVKYMEKENDCLINPYSPTKKFLHTNRFAYPNFVRLMFVKIEVDEDLIQNVKVVDKFELSMIKIV